MFIDDIEVLLLLPLIPLENEKKIVVLLPCISMSSSVKRSCILDTERIHSCGYKSTLEKKKNISENVKCFLVHE